MSRSPFMVQRFRATQNTSPEVWHRTLAALRDNPGAADEVWFSTGIGFPKMDWHRAHAARLAAAADDLRAADHVVDMGPGGGLAGGRVVATGTPEDIRRCPASVTGKFL